MEVIIITGLSGAGKSQAVNCMEDLGYYCIDNMPPRLIGEFLSLAETGTSGIDKAAFVVDIRQRNFFEDLKECLETFDRQGTDYKIMFLEASDAVLLRRYKETRRSHPMDRSDIKKGIQTEREKLSAIREKASIIIDTSNYKTADLNAAIVRQLNPEDREESFSITIESFGFKHGVPAEADWVLDARFLPNPFYLASLKKLTGNNRKVREYVMKSVLARDFVGRVVGLALDTIPGYIQEGKYSLVIAIGCTGGQHRSVALVNELADHFEELGKQVVVLHRDL